jgi:hypothetical protein
MVHFHCCATLCSNEGQSGPFFFLELAITSHVFLEVPENYVMREIEDNCNLTFQVDGALPSFVSVVRESLDRNFLGTWTFHDVCPSKFIMQFLSRNTTHTLIFFIFFLDNST